MLAALALTSLAMGLAGGAHCVAMCGAMCGGALGRGMPGGGVLAQGPRAVPRETARSAVQDMALFQSGRLGGYAALGALAAASVQGAGWLGTHIAALRPLWTLAHVALMALGLALLWRASQPAWLQAAGGRLWHTVRQHTPARMRSPLAAGALWAFMPCGLLYSALAVAALAGSAAGGALVMATFALGSGGWLAAGPWAMKRLAMAARGELGVRLAGAALAGASAFALRMDLVREILPWCA